MISLSATLAVFSGLATAEPVVLASEKDFLEDMPVVLSVSRLPQRLDETPGAVTVIDRDMIRLSGARDVAELMRWVPGFQVSSSFETDAPNASYHGAFGAFTSRVQLLIDGRSVYSTYLTGSIAMGLQSVALQDIERIEVLRGSNSAAYGARAFLGVINIVTRDPQDTLGWQLSVAAGENGVDDRLARLGWGTEAGNFRLTLDRRGDAGLSGSNGHNQVSRVNFRADLRPSASDEVQVRLGQLDIDAGIGFPGDVDMPARDHNIGSSYAQFDWRRSLGADQDIAFSAAHTDEVYRDVFSFSLLPLKQQYPVLGLLYPQLGNSVPIDVSGTASNDSLSLQHTFRAGPDVRVVWGGELRREQINSKPLYATDAALVTDFTRLFGNAEWRMTPAWVLNAGGMFEKSSTTGDSFSPRVMLNWHVADGQTLRAGTSQAYRPPSTYELAANVRYQSNGVPLRLTTVASGAVQSESVVSRELGYLGDFPKLGLNLDARLFHEQVAGFVGRAKNLDYILPAGIVIPTAPFDYINGQDLLIRGLEYQLKWRPWQGGQLVLNQAYTEIVSNNPDRLSGAPRLASSLMLFQKLPGNMELSLLHHDASAMTPAASSFETGKDSLAVTRTDLRLAKALRIDQHRAELALVLQNIGSPYADFDIKFKFERRAFITLRIEN